jgi:predicted DNA repair protein MutK
MAGGLLAFLDDITIILDDVAILSKVAAKKTAAIVGDDLAVNANVVVGLEPSRELPIVGKIALGSLANKAVLIPLALALPAAVVEPLLLAGGAFLCYEAWHKVSHKKDEADEEHHRKLLEAASDSPEALMEIEKKKVWGAIGTDTILSAEVIIVALGAISAAPLMTKALSLSVVGLAMTLGVYGLVAAIVKVDDLGLRLQKQEGGLGPRFGKFLVAAMPNFMKALSILGTVAMFSVGGGIWVHGVGAIHHWFETLPSISVLPMTLLFGVALGALVSPIFQLTGKLLGKLRPGSNEKTTAS